jgi:hypothetical protein
MSKTLIETNDEEKTLKIVSKEGSVNVELT